MHEVWDSRFLENGIYSWKIRGIRSHFPFTRVLKLEDENKDESFSSTKHQKALISNGAACVVTSHFFLNLFNYLNKEVKQWKSKAKVNPYFRSSSFSFIFNEIS